MTLLREKDGTKYPFSVPGKREKKIISPANSAHRDNVDRVPHYASVDEIKHLNPGVAGERHKPIQVWTGL